MSGWCDDVDSRRRGVVDHLRKQMSEDRSWLNYLRKQSRRYAKPCDEFRSPAALDWIEALGRRSVCELDDSGPGKPVMEQVRDSEESIGSFENRVVIHDQ